MPTRPRTTPGTVAIAAAEPAPVRNAPPEGRRPARSSCRSPPPASLAVSCPKRRPLGTTDALRDVLRRFPMPSFSSRWVVLANCATRESPRTSRFSRRRGRHGLSFAAAPAFSLAVFSRIFLPSHYLPPAFYRHLTFGYRIFRVITMVHPHNVLEVPDAKPAQSPTYRRRGN